MTIEQLRSDIADMLSVPVEEIADTDNLVDFGLDSIRLMSLVNRWTAAGVAVPFAELAERPEIRHWWNLIAARLGITR